MCKDGVWTPWAEVICRDCSSNNREELEDYYAVAELIKHCATTFCDKCGAEIQVCECVAYEHNLVATLKSLGFNAYMMQTGGMCSACCVDISNSKNNIDFVMICYNLNGNDKYLAEIYDNDGDIIYDGCDYMEFGTITELIDWLYYIDGRFESNA